eukprot:CAMPEP_0185462580 /NCGR_PEP_ID=MMETSP1365-20130426/92837_1 /TAXON_ID=38817 /ORGANISM="Gephyrocapsa oceanica, Strain RCC1303" /LENGTH=63 /DNA_ID=CAMNT_0028069267 /DNA_START=165 /DNA_END=356 /DNA_ORIENTATION=+
MHRCRSRLCTEGDGRALVGQRARAVQSQSEADPKLVQDAQRGQHGREHAPQPLERVSVGAKAL